VSCGRVKAPEPPTSRPPSYDMDIALEVIGDCTLQMLRGISTSGTVKFSVIAQLEHALDVVLTQHELE